MGKERQMLPGQPRVEIGTAETISNGICRQSRVIRLRWCAADSGRTNQGGRNIEVDGTQMGTRHGERSENGRKQHVEGDQRNPDCGSRFYGGFVEGHKAWAARKTDTR